MPLHQRRGRIIAHEVHGELARNEARAGLLPHQQLDRFGNFRKTVVGQGMPQQRLGSEVMARGIELECAITHIVAAQLGAQVWRLRAADTDPGQHPCQLLHVMLRVARINAQRVQLHQLARVILIDVSRRILRIVQILQHGRMFQCRHDEVAEMPESMRADRPLAVVPDQPADIGLLLVDAEMVEPEPDHLLFELRRRIDGAQQLTAARLVGGLIALLIERLARGLFLAARPAGR